MRQHVRKDFTKTKVPLLNIMQKAPIFHIEFVSGFTKFVVFFHLFYLFYKLSPFPQTEEVSS